MTNRGKEARRSARVATTFFVAVDGVDREPMARRGDISATGIYFETDAFIGAVGSVQFLVVRSSNRAREIRLVAQLVRSVTLEALKGQVRYGLAFEFMPASALAAAEVEKFVQYVLLVVDDDQTQPRLSSRLAAMSLAEARSSSSSEDRARARDPDRALIRQLSVRSMTLEANWSVNRGELVRVEIAAEGMRRRVRLEGAAVRVTPLGPTHDDPPYEIEVEFQSEVERPPRQSSSSMTFAAVRPEAQKLPSLADEPEDHEVSNVLDVLFSSLIHPEGEARPIREHLSGTLSRIRLPTLFAIFEMEQLTGELMLTRAPGERERERERVVIYARDGRIVDVEPTPRGDTPRAVLGRLLEWTDGTFEFSIVGVERPDRIGMSTTGLLLDLAREADEGRHRLSHDSRGRS